MVEQAEATLTSYEVARIAGVPYRTLMRWIERGWVSPRNIRTQGRGKAVYEWTQADLAQVIRLASAYSSCRAEITRLTQKEEVRNEAEELARPRAGSDRGSAP
jgi:DNA-binding transcriptional MerR regulator